MFVCYDALCLSQHFFSHDFEKKLKKKTADGKKHAKLPSMQKASSCTIRSQ